MPDLFDTSDPNSCFDYLEAMRDVQPSPEYERAIAAIEKHIEGGDLEIAPDLGRCLLLPGRCHDAAAAYKWFYIGLSHAGYLTECANELESQGIGYCGPVGDFRNEDEVSICIRELGLAPLRALDEQAKAWLAARV